MDADRKSLEKIQRGDESGLAELMERHRESLFRFTFRYLQNEADAAEITSETFYRVFRYADRYRPKAKVITWIFSIAANLSRDLLRKNKKRAFDRSLDAPLGDPPEHSLAETTAAGGTTPDQDALTEEALHSIQSAIQTLPHKLKTPFILCVLEDHSYESCAEILQTSRKTVETRIYRARQLLRQQLADWSKTGSR